MLPVLRVLPLLYVLLVDGTVVHISFEISTILILDRLVDRLEGGVCTRQTLDQLQLLQEFQSLSFLCIEICLEGVAQV